MKNKTEELKKEIKKIKHEQMVSTHPESRFNQAMDVVLWKKEAELKGRQEAKKELAEEYNKTLRKECKKFTAYYKNEILEERERILKLIDEAEEMKDIEEGDIPIDKVKLKSKIKGEAKK